MFDQSFNNLYIISLGKLRKVNLNTCKKKNTDTKKNAFRFVTYDGCVGLFILCSVLFCFVLFMCVYTVLFYIIVFSSSVGTSFPSFNGQTFLTYDSIYSFIYMTNNNGAIGGIAKMTIDEANISTLFTCSN